MTSITIVIGSGFPGHATIQIIKANETTYMGFGPVTPKTAYELGSYDIVTLPTGVSPVGALRDPALEYHYIDPQHYAVKSFTFQISDARADAAIAAAFTFESGSSNYNFFNSTICTDFALAILEAAIPGSNLSSFSRLPNTLLIELMSVAATGTFLVNTTSVPGGIAVNPGLTGIQQDSNPPNLNHQLPINDNVPFNYAGGIVETDGGPPMQFALARLVDGSATLKVGDEPAVEFAPGVVKHFSETDGKLTLSGAGGGIRCGEKPAIDVTNGGLGLTSQ